MLSCCLLRANKKICFQYKIRHWNTLTPTPPPQTLSSCPTTLPLKIFQDSNLDVYEGLDCISQHLCSHPSCCQYHLIYSWPVLETPVLLQSLVSTCGTARTTLSATRVPSAIACLFSCAFSYKALPDYRGLAFRRNCKVIYLIILLQIPP